MLMNCMCTFKVMIGSLKFLLSIGYTFEGSFICECPRPLLHVTCALCRLLVILLDFISMFFLQLMYNATAVSGSSCIIFTYHF